MPRLKSSAPKRANDDSRATLSWNLGDNAAVQNTPEINLLDDDDELPCRPKPKRRRSKEHSVVLSPVQRLIDKCDFYLTLKKEHHEPIVCCLSSFSIILEETFSNAELLQRPEFWLYVSEEPSQSLLYFEWREELQSSSSSLVPTPLHVKCFHVNFSSSFDMLRELQAKFFALCPLKYDDTARTLHIDIFLLESGLTRLNYASEATRVKPNTGIQQVIQTLYGINLPDYSGIKRKTKHDIDALYAAVKAVHDAHPSTDNAQEVQHSSLIPHLRPYQRNAVQWMLQQEQVQDEACDPLELGSLHDLYERLRTSDGKVLYYNKYGGYLVKDKPLKVARYPGGILADEMGLGKTVEVLACILCHPRCMKPQDIMDAGDSSCEDSGFISDAYPEDASKISSNNPLHVISDSPENSILAVSQISSTTAVSDMLESLNDTPCQHGLSVDNKLKMSTADKNKEIVHLSSNILGSDTCEPIISSENNFFQDSSSLAMSQSSSTAAVNDIIKSLENMDDVNLSSQLGLNVGDKVETSTIVMTDCVIPTSGNNIHRQEVTRDENDISQDSSDTSYLGKSQSASAAAIQDIISSLEQMDETSSQIAANVNGSVVGESAMIVVPSDNCRQISLCAKQEVRTGDERFGDNGSIYRNYSDNRTCSQFGVNVASNMEMSNVNSSEMGDTAVAVSTDDTQCQMVLDGASNIFADNVDTSNLAVSQSSSTAAVQDIIARLDRLEEPSVQLVKDVCAVSDTEVVNSALMVVDGDNSAQNSSVKKEGFRIRNACSDSSSGCLPSMDYCVKTTDISDKETPINSAFASDTNISLNDNAPEIVPKIYKVDLAMQTDNTNLNAADRDTTTVPKDICEVNTPNKESDQMYGESVVCSGKHTNVLDVQAVQCTLEIKYLGNNVTVKGQKVEHESKNAYLSQYIDKCNQKLPIQNGETAQNCDFKGRSKNGRLSWIVESAKEFAKKSVAPKAFFECICGAVDGTMDSRKRIQCKRCSLWQHMDCVKYESSMGPFYCPHCWVARPPVCSRATLIVSPAIIQCQWVDEIQRHLRHKALKILVYAGVHKHGFIQPQALANYDIVLTSYETLRKEIDYVDLPHSNSEAGRRFRHPKRFMAIPSPLVAVDWWRVCLDEAQMVECTSTKTAEMALRLRAANRWCVTGTPIQKGVSDLYGLLLFLGADPYWVKTWWRDCLFEPYCYSNTEPMHTVISRYLWRSAKSDVLDQINIPKQTEEVHWLSFSPVEEHFYRQQHLECSHDAVNQFNKVLDLDVKLSALDRHTLSKILFPLLRLRQACCHPQAVRGQFMSVHKSTMTMDELLKTLIKKTKIEAEEAHRQHIASLNGLASLHVIKEEWLEAVEVYREVLRLADEHSQQIKTDKLQRLHALNNLAELLDAEHANIPPTMRDSSLKNECQEIRNVYLTKCAAKVANSQDTLNSAQRSLRDLRSQFACSFPWWANLLDISLGFGKAEDLVYRVKNDLSETSGSHKRVSVANRFTDVRGLKFVVTTLFDDLQAAHSKVSKAVQVLNPQPSQEDLNAAVECHLRPTDRNPPMCTYCKVHELFNKYETKLYSFRDEDDRYVAEPSTKDDAMMLGLRKGTWADSELETIVKTIVGYAKCQNWHGLEIEDGNLHIRMFEAMKKEFKALRGVWMQIRDQVSAVDELGMATIRLRLRLEDEPKPDTPQPNILERSEIDHHRLKLLSDRIVATNERRKKLGQLLYLQNLAKSDVGKRGGSNPEPCPICQRTLGEQWSVLQCGHCFCIECIRVLTTRFGSRGRCRSLKCPICRQMTAPGEMSYVNTKTDEVEEDIKVMGSHSTKVEAVVKTLLQIQEKEPGAKALVFSTWQDVLDVLATALNQNNISFRSLSLHSKLQASLSSFKKDPNVAVLLLPVQTGANGLNLIEATHVLLVEPVLNIASEHQAIGRVHRIGQTKSTVVHRFLVKGTIEERMDAMLKSHTSVTASTHESEENTLTLRDLRNLFAEENSLTEDDDNHNDEEDDITTL